MALITETSLRARLGKGLPNPYPIAEEDKLTPAASDFLKERDIRIVRTTSATVNVIERLDSDKSLIPVGVSNRHVHLCSEHVAVLFGEGYRLKPMRELSQKGQYAAEETVTIIGPKGIIPGVRILGPTRGASQVEVSRTDGYRLGIAPPVRLSGDIQGTPGITLVGAVGSLILQEGLIVARNHVHLSSDDAKRLAIQEDDRLLLQTRGDRPLIFKDVIARISPRYSVDFHIDLDEANAANLHTGDLVQLIGKNGEFTASAKGGLL